MDSCRSVTACLTGVLGRPEALLIWSGWAMLTLLAGFGLLIAGNTEWPLACLAQPDFLVCCAVWPRGGAKLIPIILQESPLHDTRLEFQCRTGHPS